MKTVNKYLSLLAVVTLSYLPVQADDPVVVQNVEVGTRAVEAAPVARVVTPVEKSAETKGLIYYKAHPLAVHWMSSVSIFNDFITLEDGSMWEVHPMDYDKVMTFATTDRLMITRSFTFLFGDCYRLHNQANGFSIDVKLSVGPIFGTVQCHSIKMIDYLTGNIWLEDGSCWHTCSNEDFRFLQWMPGDVIIVGSDDSFACSHDSLLINVTVNNNVKGKALS